MSVAKPRMSLSPAPVTSQPVFPGRQFSATMALAGAEQSLGPGAGGGAGAGAKALVGTRVGCEGRGAISGAIAEGRAAVERMGALIEQVIG